MSTRTHSEPSREQIEIGKIFAEMMNLLEDTRKKEEERDALRAQTQKMQAEVLKIQAEAQTFKLRHAIGAFAAAVLFLAATVGLVSLFLK